MAALRDRAGYLFGQWKKEKRLDLTVEAARLLAKKEVLAGSGAVKDEEKWKGWAHLVSPVLDLCPDTPSRIATYSRLTEGSVSAVAKEDLLGELLRRAQNRLRTTVAGANRKEGTELLNAVKPLAAGFPGLSGDVQLADAMIASAALSNAGNHRGALDVLQGAFKHTRDRRDPVESLFTLGVFVLREDPRAQGSNYFANRLMVPVLRKAIEDTPGDQPTERLLSQYVKNAVTYGEGEGAQAVLSAHGATPENYLELAKLHRDYGDLDRARQALAAIPESALKSDAALAGAVGKFWPAPVKELIDEIDRTKALLQLYQGREQEAKTSGDARLVQRYGATATELQQKLAQLDGQLAALKDKK